MSYLSSKKSIIISLTVLVVVAIGLQFVNWFIYPFSSAHPNFSEVEAVYDKMQVPSTWIKTGEGANKGIAGRQCGIESNGCFSKSATFSVPTTTTTEQIKNVYIGMGCVSVAADRTEQLDGPVYTTFRCTSGGLVIAGTLKELSDGWQQSVIVSSK